MTDNVDTAPPAGGDTAPNGQQQQSQQSQQQQPNGANQQQQQSQQQSPAFTVPDAYKDKPWAAKIKSTDDLYKQIDNLDGLVGKKAVGPIDYSKATPEEIEAYHATLRPKDVNEYDFGEDADPGFSKAVGDVLLKNGISAHQGKNIVAEVKKIAGEIAGAKKAEDTSAEGYAKLMQGTFGAEAEKVSGFVEAALKQHATDDDKKLFDDVDNNTRAAIDRTLYKVLQAYGVKETGAQADGGQGKISSDKATRQKDLRQQIRDLDNKPHSAEDKQKLLDELAATYK